MRTYREQMSTRKGSRSLAWGGRRPRISIPVKRLERSVRLTLPHARVTSAQAAQQFVADRAAPVRERIDVDAAADEGRPFAAPRKVLRQPRDVDGEQVHGDAA